MTGPDPARNTEAADAVPSVEQQRAELAETVEALAHKVDVPARAKSAAQEKVHEVQVKAQERPQIVAAVVGGIVAALVVGRVARRRGKRNGKRKVVRRRRKH
ncbi:MULTISPECIES: DUF3618 domain-containing protein [Rhodococcus]|jgi:hypothetical protein|uniref:DUF3618 domain-containing protein n=1 Tax=Rhodococcus aetherivorans TaxID=191292 RepID=A0A059MVQ3_9NOCA|nr:MULTISPECIES: DUF3618 domain-containing protein [Rhodococcus]ETT28096.1 Protein of unknown function DUF3618 [Rhodococcus rhodochrous ATCC 21198]AKE88909.1 membrane protein [Rhodococcus aetherivorans]ANZ26406.1 hypothetical protein A4U64_18270 [Rhodococcus sp. WB1]KDE15112.1 membrane protein [Rhodococcus aetherivorans]MBC2591407.1 DUF3618 domain-containing protein [Rhodococcus aetherivorans]